MRVRTLELRLLAGLLVVLWAAGGIAVTVGYRPGGPADGLVALAALMPAAIAAAGVIWPPLARGERAAAAVGWLGVAAALFLVPALLGLIEDLVAGGRQPLLPSPEVGYALLVPLVMTCLFTGLGVARALLGQTSLRQRRLFLGGSLALLLTTVAAGSFGGAALANDSALREAPPADGSPLGPTDPSLTPPECDGPLRAGATAVVTISASGRLDGDRYGEIELHGSRDGDAEAWSAQRTTPWGDGGAAWYRRAGSAWLEEGGQWRRVAAQPTLDSAIVATVLRPDARVAAEDVGVESVEGARARHCRLALDGPAAFEAMPVLRWLVGDEPVSSAPTLVLWRGQIDWWAFGDEELGMARLVVYGQPPGEWPLTGFGARIESELVARQRDQPHPVEPPFDLPAAGDGG